MDNFWEFYRGRMSNDFCFYSEEYPVYRNAAIGKLNYFMKMRVNGLITYGPNYSEMFDNPPCIYPTFSRAKNLALLLYTENKQKEKLNNSLHKKSDGLKYFKTLDLVLVRTKNFMATITGYRYKDIRRGADLNIVQTERRFDYKSLG